MAAGVNCMKYNIQNEFIKEMEKHLNKMPISSLVFINQIVTNELTARFEQMIHQAEKDND